MSNYKRIFLDNHYYFLTVIINNRKLTLLTDYINEFKLALKAVKSQYAFKLHAISVMPDHFHMIIMPNVAKEYPTIVSDYGTTPYAELKYSGSNFSMSSTDFAFGNR